MEIKYEAVFGDQSLFVKGPEDANIVGKYMGNPRFYKVCDSGVYFYQQATWHKADKDYPGVPLLAMRRIIRTPTWSVADQKAGKLPEVSCRVNFCHKLNANWRTGEIKYIDDQVVVIKTDDVARPFVYEVDRVEFNPIESPEEKSARLREEWKNNVIEIHQGKRRKMSTSTFLLDDIYDALLSGKLAAPKGGE